MNDERRWETAIPERMHMTGANTSIRRTITPCGVCGRCECGCVCVGTYSKVDGGDSIQDDKDVLIS